MAFMQVSTGSSDGDGGARLPVLSYNAKAGRLFTLDREQNSEGLWETSKVDVTMAQPAFAVDLGCLEIGWIYFHKAAAPSFVVTPYGQPMPAKPPSPGGVDDNGKPTQYKQGFRLKVVGKDIGGVRELSGNSGAVIEGLNQLHTDYEAAPEAAAGMIPLVKMTMAVPIKSGKSENFMPVFTVQKWVARPDILGPRTVLPPIVGARTAAPPKAAAPAAAVHVPPPPPKAAAPMVDPINETDLPF